MNFLIKNMNLDDKTEVLQMMRVFYSSDAVATNGSDEIFETNFENCINSSPFLNGYVFKDKNIILGYAIVALSFSTEFGQKCIWLEDLYVKPEFRRLGIISHFFKFIENQHFDCIFKLEVENYNTSAIEAYKKNGFTKLPYIEMIKIQQ